MEKLDAKIAELLNTIQMAIVDHGPEAWEITALAIKISVFNEIFIGVAWSLLFALIGFFGVRATIRHCKANEDKWDETAYWWGTWGFGFLMATFSGLAGLASWANIKSWAVIIEPKLFLVYKALHLI